MIEPALGFPSFKCSPVYQPTVKASAKNKISKQAQLKRLTSVHTAKPLSNKAPINKANKDLTQAFGTKKERRIEIKLHHNNNLIMTLSDPSKTKRAKGTMKMAMTPPNKGK